MLANLLRSPKPTFSELHDCDSKPWPDNTPLSSPGHVGLPGQPRIDLCTRRILHSSKTWPFLSSTPAMITNLHTFNVMSDQEVIGMSRKQQRRSRRSGARLHRGKAGTPRMGDDFALWGVRCLM